MATATILRFNPKTDASPHYETYEFAFKPGITVLDVLIQVQDQHDPDFTFSYCCRDHHCGLCGMMINGIPGLACKTTATETLKLEPLRGMPIVKDLVIDRSFFSKARAGLILYMQRGQETEQMPEEIRNPWAAEFRYATRCVECLCCLAACPVWQKSPGRFAGPTAFVDEARYFFDSRDEQKRSLLLQAMGIDACVECGACSKVCEPMLNPCGLIQAMKRQSGVMIPS